MIYRLADITDDVKGYNLLHQAAEIAVTTEDCSFFVRLLDLRFPLYHETFAHEFPAFLLTEIKNDCKFLTCYSALQQIGFDPNFENS